MTGMGFLVDLHRCVGCAACVVACRIENGRTVENAWRRVLPLNLRRHPGGPAYFLSVACHHCDRPACLRGCPSRAYEKRSDGVIVHHEDRCLGCRYCEMTCPFGAPQYDQARGVVSKCHLCSHRLDRGLDPACVAACPTKALSVAKPGELPADVRLTVPGFADPGACGPSLAFRLPRGARREPLYRALEKQVTR
jgi:Fe-S-cluster-containing dehydrogenase component